MKAGILSGYILLCQLKYQFDEEIHFILCSYLRLLATL